MNSLLLSISENIEETSWYSTEEMLLEVSSWNFLHEVRILLCYTEFDEVENILHETINDFLIEL